MKYHPSAPKVRRPSASAMRADRLAFSVGKCLGLGLAAAFFSAADDARAATATWQGTLSSDYNVITGGAGGSGNWDSNPNGSDVVMNNTTNTGVFPVINATPTFTPVDIRIGTTGGTGRLDQTAGTLSTGNGNWMLVGYVGSNATYNLANTAATGGTFTGYGTGSGSLNIGGTTANGYLLAGLDANTSSTININTTGTVNGGSIYLGGANAPSGALNIDNGTITLSGDLQIGASAPYGNGAGTQTMRMSGGTLIANTISFSRGSNNTAAMTSNTTLTGGTINARGGFTLGFAGSATNISNVTVSGATVNVNTAPTTNNTGNLDVGYYDATVNTMTVNSGSVNVQNNASILFGSGGNHTGTSTFTQNGGTVSVGGTGAVNLGATGSSGTYTYNLNGGTLTTPSVTRAATGGSGTFNFNGGILQATQASTAFMGGLTAANVRNSAANINTNGFDVTISQALNHSAISGDAAADGGLTKTGAGTLTLTSASNYTGATVVSAGGLALTGGSLTASVSLTLQGTSVLTLNSAGALADALTLRLVSGTTLNLNAGASTSETIGRLFLNGTAVAPGTYRASDLAGAAGAAGITFASSGETLIVSVPEPSTFALAAVGLGAAAACARRRRAQAWLRLTRGA